ncbi:MAG TPA: TolC family protein [Steroidobacteraceae bacterium]|nr:TolC family protein [Steroidobacteraceae bacterium]
MRRLWLLIVAATWAARGLAQTPPPAPTPAPAAAVPLTLAEAHAIALQNHPQIAAATYQAQAQQQVYLQARSGLLPQVTAYGDAVHADSDNTRLMAGGINNPSVFSRTAIGASLTQLITDFGHTTNLAASARLQASAAEQSSLSTREQVLLQVDQAYFGALQAHGIESVARQTLDTRQLLLDRVSVLAENKLKSDLDVSFARVALEQARLLVQRAQNDVDSSLAALSTVLGYREQRTFALADETSVPVPASADVQPLIDQALQDRPELAGLRDQRDAAQRLALSFRDARLPTISALVAAGNSPSHDARLPANYSAGGIQVSVPVFAGGLYEARQHEAELRARAAAESLRTVEDDISRDVRIAWLNLNNARQRLRTNQQLARYAADAYQLADARYRVGSSSIVELSQAQLELTTAQIDETAARYEVLLRESDLNYQIGATAGTTRAAPDAPADRNALP